MASWWAKFRMSSHRPGRRELTQTVEGLERYPVNLRYFQDYRQNFRPCSVSSFPLPAAPRSPWPRSPRSKFVRDRIWSKAKTPGGPPGSLLISAISTLAPISSKAQGAHRFPPEDSRRLLLGLERSVRVYGAGPAKTPDHHPHHPGPGRHPASIWHTGSFVKVLIILLAVPFSLVGAIWLLYFLNYNISVGVIVGIIALAGPGCRNRCHHAPLPRHCL